MPQLSSLMFIVDGQPLSDAMLTHSRSERMSLEAMTDARNSPTNSSNSGSLWIMEADQCRFHTRIPR